jgi:hypothetical protein
MVACRADSPLGTSPGLRVNHFRRSVVLSAKLYGRSGTANDVAGGAGGGASIAPHGGADLDSRLVTARALSSRRVMMRATGRARPLRAGWARDHARGPCPLDRVYWLAPLGFSSFCIMASSAFFRLRVSAFCRGGYSIRLLMCSAMKGAAALGAHIFLAKNIRPA